jgi:hypothetical protein
VSLTFSGSPPFAILSIWLIPARRIERALAKREGGQTFPELNISPVVADSTNY